MIPISEKGNMPSVRNFSITVMKISSGRFVRVMKDGELVAYQEFDRDRARRGAFGIALPTECQDILASMVKGGEAAGEAAGTPS